MTSVLDRLLAKCGYSGTQFFMKKGQAYSGTFRFDAVGTLAERVAPGSFPAVVSFQVINTGLYSSKTSQIYIKEANYNALRAKVLQGFQNLTLADGVVLSVMLTGLKEIGVTKNYDLVICQAEWKGR